MKTQTLTITVETLENNSTFSIKSDLNPYEQLGVLELAKLQTFRQISGCSVNSIQAVSKPTLKTIKNLQIDNEDLAGLYDLGEAKKQIEILNNLNYKGFSDWRLPDKEELNLMYVNKNEIVGFSSNAYWSSTEYVADYAWGQNFNNGSQNYYNKLGNIQVRCVRSV